MSLSQSQLRLLSSIGVGILVGTSLIVIIPEGIEAVATAGPAGHTHNTRSVGFRGSLGARWDPGSLAILQSREDAPEIARREFYSISDTNAIPELRRVLRDEQPTEGGGAPPAPKDDPEHHEGHILPTFYIGFSLMLGFVLMFLIDRLPRHATESFQAPPATRHISLDNLAASSVSGEEESEGFLESLAPTPKQSRSLATTTGLVIHAAADGIAMGASATTTNMKLGLIIFVAIMIHKAPAAFGLTSVLLKQGLSKRAARGHLIVFSLAAPFGALATYLIISILGGSHMDGESGQWWTGMLLLFSAGTFL
jgi:zinc transporter 9